MMFHGHTTQRRRRRHRGGYTCRGKCKPLQDRSVIARQIKPISRETILQDYQALHKLGKEESPINTARILGNRIVDFFTFEERLNTVSKHKIRFYDFLADFDFYKRKPYIAKFIRENKASYNADRLKFIYKIFRFYAGSVQIFKPVQTMEVIRQIRPRVAILDPTMGWGGRLVGACAMDVPKYIGIDNNQALRQPYAELSRFLQKAAGAKTVIDLRFMDALQVDYSRLKYDMVLTSPPYYNIEKYGDGEEPRWKTKAEWNTEFYIPLFERTWAGLEAGGSFCLNVSPEIYSAVCVPTLGEAPRRIPLSLNKKIESDYAEFIYVWTK